MSNLKTDSLLKNKRVLIVDDDRASQMLSCSKLLAFFEAIDFASSGDEALKMIAKERYSFTFMDIEMPNMNGFETTVKIREFEKNQYTPKNQTMVITALSGIALNKDLIKKCLESGMDDCLVKPLSDEVVGQRLRIWEIGNYPLKEWARNLGMTFNK